MYESTCHTTVKIYSYMAHETVFDILKYGNYRPVRYRKILDVYFADTNSYVSDWKEVPDSKFYDHMYLHTHFVRVDVYFDMKEETTIVSLRIRDNEISQIIVDNNYDVSIHTQIQPDRDYDTRFLEIFDEFYKEMFEACLGIEYKLEHYPDDIK